MGSYLPTTFQEDPSNCAAAEMQRQQDHIITAVELPGKGRRGIIEKKPTLNIEVERRHVQEVQREHADIREAREKAWNEMQDLVKSWSRDEDKTLCRITDTLSW